MLGNNTYSQRLSGVLNAAMDAPIVKAETTSSHDDAEDVLRLAATMAVLSIIDSREDTSRVGRNSGSSWSMDHRRVQMGKSDLMTARSRRAIWR